MAAAGAGTENSLITIAGGMAGATVYGIFADSIQRNVLNRGNKGGPCSQVYADEVMGLSSPAPLTLILGVTCFCVCYILETSFPWKSEVPGRLGGALNDPVCVWGGNFNYWECPAWPPSVAGMMIGFLQLPSVMFIGNALGSSTAFQIVSSLCMAPLPSSISSKYVQLYAKPNPLVWFQLPFIGVAVAASYLSAEKASDLEGAAGVDQLSAFVGGFLLIFGSRLGGACTTGHGLSGCVLLMMQSWIAVAAMFIGGITVASFLKSELV